MSNPPVFAHILPGELLVQRHMDHCPSLFSTNKQVLSFMYMPWFPPQTHTSSEDWIKYRLCNCTPDSGFLHHGSSPKNQPR